MTKPLWTPHQNTIQQCHLQHFMHSINTQYDLNITHYSALYQWSIDYPSDFWKSVSDFCNLRFSQEASQIMLSHEKMQKTKWFIDATLNFAENLLWRRDNHIALIAANEQGERKSITYHDLYVKTARLTSYLQSLGIQPGDRVAGYLSNRIEAVIAMLASASIGAIWSVCSPEFGLDALYERFSQIKPRVLFVEKQHGHSGKIFQHEALIHQLKNKLTSVEQVIVIDDEVIPTSNHSNSFHFTQLPFDHPLYILYSSGTTGKPKCMAHGAGNTLIQHKKELMLHTDLHSDDKIFFYTTCSWMMWHWMISSLSVGCTVVLYEGSPFYPKNTALFDLIDEFDISIFGCGAKIIETLLKNNVKPNQTHRLKKLKTILTTGSPLIKESFEYIYQHVKSDIRVSSISGGSDIISCFALGNPLLPVYAEELQCRGLGMRVEIFDDRGHSLKNQPGELVCAQAFPSMPIYFWNDPDGEKYQHAYFDRFKNIWAHGDYAMITSHDGVIIYGRSDATLNPGGIRIGTAEIYEEALKFKNIADCVAVGKQKNGDEDIILFVKMAENFLLDDELITQIKKNIRDHLSPYHVPKQIIAVSDIPKTVNGKTMEIAVKNIIDGKEVKNTESLSNPECLEEFKKFTDPIN